jgi:antitoxin VapB
MLKQRPMETGLTPERHVKLFKNGRNQAVRIPREFELPGEDAIMRKDGLVTDNEAAFARIDGLAWENWQRQT